MLRLFEGLKLDLHVAQLNQLLVPAPLQLTGDQPVIGIDGVVRSPCPGGFVLSLLDRILDVLTLVAMIDALGLHRSQRRFNPKRLQSIEDLLGDRAIDPHAAEADTVVGRFGAERAAAGISLCIPALSSVVDVQASATARATE